ncbi:uncharacterized protein AKAW2_40257A [Aspergillus luchuensis]|uniref:Similar to An03g02950 n=1 Tax=Aspergillus kawachii TaxID=1069201 RepID=A0A146F3X3_ASPKA|nr:uncharacterized protein AKAW2_40257A [Aspergillus luchuensis]BCR98574.1 hypothetical protein AKAW2_40257A [Aspergillus luchuensis]BCS10908.1 hypothetical protein ALUC_40248A [Aspergillus luchuensis]GAA92401.1 similar to An03g02950 [Aspergillus luchuensis IFO 4308]GAT20817.1 similar to An03g02950 [Aspergillus luchuensis]
MAQSVELTHATPTHIPSIAEPLAPYIKSRQDALLIRQALTIYLRSHIEFAKNNNEHPECHSQSHLSLSVPHEAVVDVKRLPSELTGLRRQYLEALQSNVAARREYQSVVEKLTSVGHERSKPRAENSTVDSSAELQEYLRLLRDRRRHAKLQVFEHYIKELKQRDTPKPADLEDSGIHYQQLAPPPEIEVTRHGSTTGLTVEEQLHNLEKAVIRAKAQLEREKGLLEELQAQQAPVEAQDIPHAVQGVALQRTRNELVRWVEEKLVSAGNNENRSASRDFHSEDMDESVRLLGEKKAHIAQQYAAYADARKRLLDAASRACQPVTLPAAKPSSRPTSLVQGKNASEGTQSLDALGVLTFASDVLQPLARSQRALALQKFYLSGMLAKEKATTLRILSRLRDESHLLPEYPTLARQPRFKHATATLASHQATSTESTKPDQLVDLAEAWASASDAAGMAEQEYVEYRLEEGIETAQDAQQALEDAYRILNQNLEDTLRDRQGESGEDSMWPSGARLTRSRAKMQQSQQPAKGPWSGLHGQVAVGREDDL